MEKNISSLHNPLIKNIIQLQEKSRARKKSGFFIIEGLREIELALQGEYILDKVLVCLDIMLVKSEFLTQIQNEGIEIIELSQDVYKKIAYRDSTEGILALAKQKSFSLNNLSLANTSPLILVAEAPEKPGNIGAILRTADAAGVDAVIIANPKTDLYNPNIIRSSVGCVFTNKIATGTTSEIITFLKKNNISIYSAILQESVEYHTCDYTSSCAIIVGAEATGLSQEWRNESKANINIPMQGKIDSMNVSVAAGILIFEAKRQRGFD